MKVVLALALLFVVAALANTSTFEDTAVFRENVIAESTVRFAQATLRSKAPAWGLEYVDGLATQPGQSQFTDTVSAANSDPRIWLQRCPATEEQKLTGACDDEIFFRLDGTTGANVDSLSIQGSCQEKNVVINSQGQCSGPLCYTREDACSKDLAGAIRYNADTNDISVCTFDATNGESAWAILDRSEYEGPKGDTGDTGPKGSPGVKGDAGSDGSDGAKGEPGSDGSDGADGAKGEPGTNGSDGSDGAKGEPGADGAKGEAGSDGADGSDGAKGEAGSDGADGAKGEPGADGAKGEPGVDGAKGEPGTDGQDGAPGAKGEPGDATGQGSKGEPGEAGAKGDAGSDGAKGEPGADGAKGEPGADGAKGEPGTDGQDGSPGEKGEPGEFAGKGDKGDEGSAGEPGPKGDQGDKGDQGEPGAFAGKGDPGQKGEPGTDGTDGIDGAPGLKGDQGEKGDAGDPVGCSETGYITVTEPAIPDIVLDPSFPPACVRTDCGRVFFRGRFTVEDAQDHLPAESTVQRLVVFNVPAECGTPTMASSWLVPGDNVNGFGSCSVSVQVSSDGVVSIMPSQFCLGIGTLANVDMAGVTWSNSNGVNVTPLVQ